MPQEPYTVWTEQWGHDSSTIARPRKTSIGKPVKESLQKPDDADAVRSSSATTPMKPSTSTVHQLDSDRREAAQKPWFSSVINSCLYTDGDIFSFFEEVTATQHIKRIAADIDAYLKKHPDKKIHPQQLAGWIQKEGMKGKSVQLVEIEMIHRMMHIVLLLFLPPTYRSSLFPLDR